MVRALSKSLVLMLAISTAPVQGQAAAPGDVCVADADCVPMANAMLHCEAGRCVLACDPGFALQLDGQSCTACLPTEVRAGLEVLWANMQDQLTDELRAGARGNGTVLYNAQVSTNPLLHAADRCDDVGWLDALSRYVLVAYTRTGVVNGATTWVDSSGAELGALDLSQWFYLNINLMRAITEISDIERTDAMRSLLANAPIVADAYRRWILDERHFNFHGWECDGGLPFAMTGDFTLAAWVRTQDPEGLIAIRGGTYYRLDLRGGVLKGSVITDAWDPVLQRPETRFEGLGMRRIDDGAWHHVAMVADPNANEVRLYVDGQEDGAFATEGAVRQWGSAWIDIGGYDYGFGRCCFLAGTIRQVRLYRRALSETELADVAMCGEATQACPDAGLVAAWPLDGDGREEKTGEHPLIEGSATPAADGRGMVFDGQRDNLRTHDYGGDQNHLWILRGMTRHSLAHSDSSPGYCHGLNDIDLWFIAGASELLAARALEGAPLGLTDADAERLAAYLDEALDLVQSRLDVRLVEDFEGLSRFGLVLDKGYWDEHPERQHSAYEGADFPTAESISPAAGWDLSHGRRLVDVFGSLHANREMTGKSFPNEWIMAGLANQFAYASFNGDLERPLFRNFMGGPNGWYRWDYLARPGFGYQPYDLSVAGMTGGYGFLADYNEDIADIQRSLWRLVASDEPDLIAHRETYYGRYWNVHQRIGGISVDPTNSYELLRFLPTFAQAASTPNDSGAGGGPHHLIAGHRLVVREVQGKPDARSLKVLSRDAGIEAPATGSAGDPTLWGATLQIANPLTGETDVHQLPAAGWKALGRPAGSKGYNYREKSPTNGPCRRVRLTPGRLLGAVCKGKQIGFTLDQAHQGLLTVVVQLGSDIPYCMSFSGTSVRRDAGFGSGGEVGRFDADLAPEPVRCPLP